MFETGNDSMGYYVSYDNGNENKGICRKINISLSEFNKYVKRYNGAVVKYRRFDNDKLSYLHRFDTLQECQNFIKKLESIIVLDDICN